MAPDLCTCVRKRAGRAKEQAREASTPTDKGLFIDSVGGSTHQIPWSFGPKQLQLNGLIDSPSE